MAGAGDGVLETITLSDREGGFLRGPARIVVAKGALDVFGKLCHAGDEIVVSYGKTYPLQARSNTTLNVFYGSSSKWLKTEAHLIPTAWRSLANLLMDGETKVAMVLGATDTGKSSLVLYSANQLCSAGYTVAVVDADIGQSNVGPPGVIGFCRVEASTLSLRETPLLTGYFVGDNNPSGHFLDMVLGTKWMVDEALTTDAAAVLIDTTGMVHGGPARALKEKKIEAVAPDLIVALQRDGEIEHLLAPFRNRFRILRLPVPPTMKATSREERIALRGFSMRKHIQDGQKLTLNLEKVGLRETVLGTGAVKPAMKGEVSKMLRCEVLHVEEAPDTLIAVVKGAYAGEHIRQLRAHYEKVIRIVRNEWLERLMLGLLDAEERLLDIGFLEALNFSERQLIVSTQLKDETAVKYVKLGYLRIDQTGKEIGRREIGTF